MAVAGNQSRAEWPEKVTVPSGRPTQSNMRLVIDHSRQLANAYENSERTHQTILAALPSVLIGLDGDGVIFQWNPAAVACLGVETLTAIGCTLLSLPMEWDIDAVISAFERCRQSGEVAKADEVSFCRPDGTSGILGITVNPLPLGEDSAGALILAAEITERLMLERQLLQAQKLESIGQLAAGIAHEINTPTQYVSDNTRYLREALVKVGSVLYALSPLMGEMPPDESMVDRARAAWAKAKVENVLHEAGEAITESLEGLSRIATIVRAMKEFSHPGSKEMVLTDLNRCIESTTSVTRNEWKYVAELKLDLDPEMPHVPCLAGEFNQVIANMIINAAHAIGEKVGETGEMGIISIRTLCIGTSAVITIEDTGKGIPEAIRNRIFDPFFTTKEVGKGTGQGLAIAHDVIVKRLKGSLLVDSTVGVGTTFQILLPVSAEEVTK